MSYLLQKALPVVPYKVMIRLEELYGFRNNDEGGMPSKQPRLCRSSFVSVTAPIVIVIDFPFPTLFTGRNPDYLKLSVQFTSELLAMTTFLRLVPPFLRP